MASQTRRRPKRYQRPAKNNSLRSMQVIRNVPNLRAMRWEMCVRAHIRGSANCQSSNSMFAPIGRGENDRSLRNGPPHLRVTPQTPIVEDEPSPKPKQLKGADPAKMLLDLGANLHPIEVQRHTNTWVSRTQRTSRNGQIDPGTSR